MPPATMVFWGLGSIERFVGVVEATVLLGGRVGGGSCGSSGAVGSTTLQDQVKNLRTFAVIVYVCMVCVCAFVCGEAKGKMLHASSTTCIM